MNTFLLVGLLSGCMTTPRIMIQNSGTLIIQTETVTVRDTVKLDKYFNSDELECGCGCGAMITEKAFDAITALRRSYGKPLHINSAARCETHNKAVGGVANSRHFTHRDAFDVRIGGGKNEIPYFIHKAVLAGFKGFGLLNLDNATLHIDMRDVYTMWTY